MTRMLFGSVTCAAVIALGACSQDSGAAKADSAAVADSISAAVPVDSAAAAAGSAVVDSIHPPAGSTEGTIGETRKRPGGARHTDSIIGRDSAIPGPYKTMDSVGGIKRQH